VLTFDGTGAACGVQVQYRSGSRSKSKE